MSHRIAVDRAKRIPLKAAAALPPVLRVKSLHMLMPWSCAHYADRSEIKAYVEGTGAVEVVAEVRETAGVDAERIADFIVRAVNDFEKMRELTRQMMAALALCLDCKLTWEAEHEADVMLRQAEEVLKG